MNDKKIRESYNNFISELLKIKITRERWSVYYGDSNSIFDYWDSISYAEKKRLISCYSWNYYPSENWGQIGNRDSRKSYGPIIREIIRFYYLSSKKDKDIFVKYSQGLFAVCMFDMATSSERMKMSKRLVGSKDARVKTRVLDTLPIDKIRWALHDSSYTIRNKALKRIGLDNCYKEFIPEKMTRRITWIQRQALTRANYDDIKHLLEDLDSGAKDWVARCIVDKIPKEDILYHLDKQNIGRSTASIIQIIMGIRQ